MKLVRYGVAGQVRPGLIDDAGELRSLYPLVEDLVAERLTPDYLAMLQALDPRQLPLVKDQPLVAPVTGIRQILAIGLNYLDHVEESNMAVPEYPVLFYKALGSLSGPDDPIRAPRQAMKLDWELELGAVIGSKAVNVSAGEARQHIAGYCVTLDMSERDWQFSRGGQFGKGKSYDSFTPIGPWLVTPDEIADPHALSMTLTVNGVTRQNGTTGDMLFKLDALIAHLSAYQTLLPGDLILTGTPAGVAFGMAEPAYLQHGDVLECSIQDLGSQKHVIELF